MKIGIMLRALDENGGIGVYARNLAEELIHIDKKNEYVLFYKTETNIGNFSSLPNVKEIYVRGRNKILWDQYAVVKAARNEKLDLLINPKFTVPLTGRFKKIMVVHGADWFIPKFAKYYNRLDVSIVKFLMPKYVRACDKIISVSEITTEDYKRIFNLRDEKVRTIYFGPAKFFKKVYDESEIKRVKIKYSLPDKFILSLSRYGSGGGLRKNIDKLLGAIKKVYEKNNQIKFVIGGKNVEKYIDELNLRQEVFVKNIIFTGWIEQEDLPAVYSSCEMYLYPSNVEAFPIPITEAMTCGTPVITSDANGLREIAGDAAFFVDHEDEYSIANAVLKLLEDPKLRKELSDKGLERAKLFSWDKCARETLMTIEEVLFKQEDFYENKFISKFSRVI